MDEKPRLLLVDDEAAITTNLAPFLERSGFAVTVAADGEEALRQMDASPPAIVIMDVMMPKVDGREALRRLRRAGNWTPVILLTQVGESSERAMALEEGLGFYFYGIVDGQWGLYFQRLGDPPQPLVSGLGTYVMFDVRR